MMDLFQQAFFHTHAHTLYCMFWHCSLLSQDQTPHYYSATVLCNRTTTMLQFWVMELPHWYSSVWENYYAYSVMRGNYDTATFLCGRTTTLLLCMTELPHSYISVCGKYHSATALWLNHHTVTVPGNYHTGTLLSRELLHCYSSVSWKLNLYNSVWWT